MIQRLILIGSFSCAVAAQADSLGSNYQPYSFATLAGRAGSVGSADGTGSAALFGAFGVTVDNAGNIFISDEESNTIRKVTRSGVVSTVAGLAQINPQVGYVYGSTDGTGSAARFHHPAGLAADKAGNVYVADSDNNTIRRMTPAGLVTTLAGLAGIAGSADGVGSAARFNYPRGVAVDSATNVYVADFANHTIRKVAPSGTNWVVTTMGGLSGQVGSADGPKGGSRFNYPSGVAVDIAHQVYVADSGNNTIRKMDISGYVTTLAGLAGYTGSSDNPAIVRFNQPAGVAVDIAGNVYVADSGNYTIRVVKNSTQVRTLGGLAGSTGSTDGTGSAARFRSPSSVAIDSDGNVFVADYRMIRAGAFGKLTPQAAPYQVQAQGFLASFSAQPGIYYRVQSSSDSFTWQDLTNFYATATTFQLVDIAATNLTKRFYRVSSQ